jgi:hypothetical protein
MATDATTLLIQRISSQSGQGATSAQNSITSLLSQVNSVVGNAASYAQLLSTAEGPAASALANAYVGSVAADEIADGATATAAAATAGAAAAAAGAASAGIGAAAVLIVSFIVAFLTEGSSGGPTETEQLNELQNDLANLSEANYWQTKIAAIISFWNSPTGGLGTDLYNLANEGIGPKATEVHNDVTKFHDNASAFVNNFLPSLTPGAQQIYWQRPIDPSQTFTIGSETGWYGNPPQPQAAPAPLGGSAEQWVLDPRSAMPYLLLGIKCYLRIEALLNLIDKSQPTFQEFLSQFQGALQYYASFIYSQYQIAVNGIVKSDMPTTDDVEALFWGILTFIQSSFPNDTGSTPEGDWGGQYGAVDQYPQYGVYQPSPTVYITDEGTAAPSWIIDIINENADVIANLSITDTDPLGSLMTDYGPQQTAILGNVVVPWVKGKVILGRMARWKAIYLNNGYDQLWSILQNLRRVAGQTALATPTLDQDGTIANGNWSARELCTILNANLPNLALNSDVGQGYSLSALTKWLDGIALSSWGVGGASVGPLGFRDRLAAAAV